MEVVINSGICVVSGYFIEVMHWYGYGKRVRETENLVAFNGFPALRLRDLFLFN